MSVDTSSPRHASALSILQSVEALETEVEELKLALAQKDCQIQALNEETAELTDGLVQGKAYPICSSSFKTLRKLYARGCRTPIIGAIPRFYLNAVDVVVRNATPLSGGYEELGSKMEDMLHYFDHCVLSPQVNACKASALAISEPVFRVTTPYAERAWPYTRIPLDVARKYRMQAMMSYVSFRKRFGESVPRPMGFRWKRGQNSDADNAKELDTQADIAG